MGCKAIVLFGEYPYDELCTKYALDAGHEVYPLSTNPNAAAPRQTGHIKAARVVELGFTGLLVKSEVQKMLMLLTLAHGYAEELNTSVIYIGFNKTVHFNKEEPYLRCPRNLIDAYQSALNSTGGRLWQIKSPLIFFDQCRLRRTLELD